MFVSARGLLMFSWFIAGVANAAAPDEASKAAIAKLLQQQRGQTILRIDESEKDMDNGFIRDVVKPRQLQSATITCETNDPEFDGVVCLLEGFPTQGFSVGLSGCPLGTELFQEYFACGFCFVFAGDLDDEDFCDSCSLCSNHDIGFDCTNTATGECALYSCQTGLCGGQPSSPAGPPPSFLPPTPSPRTPSPTPFPVFAPVASPTPRPTPFPVFDPVASPTPRPTPFPVSAPVASSTPLPTPVPTPRPTPSPTPEPTPMPIGLPGPTEGSNTNGNGNPASHGFKRATAYGLLSIIFVSTFLL